MEGSNKLKTTGFYSEVTKYLCASTIPNYSTHAYVSSSLNLMTASTYLNKLVCPLFATLLHQVDRIPFIEFISKIGLSSNTKTIGC